MIGGSAGAMSPLRAIVSNLPKDLPAAVFVVMHTAPGSPGMLPDILNHWNSLPAAHAEHGASIREGRIYVAPPDHHLLLHQGVMHVSKGPRENRFRPAIDPLFRTAARAYGPQVAAVLLSGGLNDGTYGLMIVKQKGGVAVVQDPQDAEYPICSKARSKTWRPTSLCLLPKSRHCLRTSWRSRWRRRAILVTRATTIRRTRQNRKTWVYRIVRPTASWRRWSAPTAAVRSGNRTMGSSSAIAATKGTRTRRSPCSPGQSAKIEDALWAALRALDENGELLRRMADRARATNRHATADTFEEQAAEANQRADLIRRVLLEKEG